MKPREFYEAMTTVQDGERVTLTSEPLEMVAGWQDAMAARLMLWLLNELPADYTQGDLEEVLGNALWWSRFWAQLHYAQKEKSE